MVRKAIVEPENRCGGSRMQMCLGNCPRRGGIYKYRWSGRRDSNPRCLLILVALGCFDRYNFDYTSASIPGNYTESWIWIWNVPMPQGAIDSDLNWKRGVSTVGVQGITARGPGGVDEYLDWAAPAYARLYEYTNDPHYRDVARILLLDTKSMLALPGRTYDLPGPGWQQEHWGMAMNRGFGTHRSWLPWVSVNHLHSITGLEEFDPALYRSLASGK